MNKNFSLIVFSVALLTVTGAQAAVEVEQASSTTTVSVQTEAPKAPEVQQPAAPAQVEVPAQTETSAQAPVEAPKAPEAVIVVEVEQPAAAAQVEVPAQTETPVEAPKAPEVQQPAAPAQVEVPAQTETSAQAPVEAPKASEVQQPAAPAQTEVPAQTENSAQAPVEAPKAPELPADNGTRQLTGLDEQVKTTWKDSAKAKFASAKTQLSNGWTFTKDTTHKYTWSTKNRKYATIAVGSLLAAYATYKLYGYLFPTSDEEEEELDLTSRQ